jgi:hypothetical protein
MVSWKLPDAGEPGHCEANSEEYFGGDGNDRAVPISEEVFSAVKLVEIDVMTAE